MELDEKSWFGLETDPPQLAGGTINACDLEAGTGTERTTDVPNVTAITFGPDGALWAKENVLLPGSAEVVTIP